MELNGRKKVVRARKVVVVKVVVVCYFLYEKSKNELRFWAQFSGFFVRLLLTNERASDWNISGAYTRGSKEDLESVFKKIPYEHTSDLHCKSNSKIPFEL